jgi:potassium-transporting ATPase ATP-binding subunit
MSVSLAKSSAFSQAVVLTALKSAVAKLDPRQLTGNPVILATEVVAALATVSAIVALAGGQPAAFAIQIAVWLWLTVIFANFAEAIAEGRGKAAADSLRATRVTTKAKLIIDAERNAMIPTPAHELAPGDVVLVEAGDVIPADGEIIEGVASVNEAAITGESAPRSSPTGSRSA